MSVRRKRGFADTDEVDALADSAPGGSSTASSDSVTEYPEVDFSEARSEGTKKPKPESSENVSSDTPPMPRVISRQRPFMLVSDTVGAIGVRLRHESADMAQLPHELTSLVGEYLVWGPGDELWDLLEKMSSWNGTYPAEHRPKDVSRLHWGGWDAVLERLPSLILGKRDLEVRLDYGSRSMLGHAARCGWTDLVRLLLERGADLNSRSNVDCNNNYSPLVDVIRSHSLGALQVLLDFGANPLCTKTEGVSAIEWVDRRIYVACSNVPNALDAKQIIVAAGYDWPSLIDTLGQ